MGYQFSNNWPYDWSVFPSMDEHTDPVNNEYFTGLHTEVENIEETLGKSPQGSYDTVADRLDDIVGLATKVFRKIYEEDVSAVSQHDITGLDGDTDKVYHIYIDGILSSSGSAFSVYLIPNLVLTGNLDVTGIRWEQGAGLPTQGSSHQSDKGFGLLSLDVLTEMHVHAHMILYPKTGKMRGSTCQAVEISNVSGPDYQTDNVFSAWDNTANNITSLRFKIDGDLATFTGKIMVFALR